MYSLQALLKKDKKFRGGRDEIVRDVHDFSNHFDSPESFALEAHEILLKFPQQRWYLKQRGIDESVERLWLGWYDGWYTFPIKTENESITGVILRAGPSIEKYYPNKYVVLPKGHPQALYIPEWRLLKQARHVFVPFGIIDAISLNMIRLASAAPIYGQTTHAFLFDGIRKNIHIIPDQGEENTARILASRLDWRGHVDKLPFKDNEKDVNNIFLRDVNRLQTALAY